jgi:16S rRNA processing protein RimM
LTSSSDLLTVGVIGRPHGLDGSFHVTRARAALLEHGAEVVVDGQPRTIERRSGTPERPIIRLSGATDRSAAESLRGQELRVPRSAAGPLDADEYWAEDLVGCAVVDGETAVGTVRRLLAYPSCELLEVERDRAPVLLVPLVRDAVRNVDIDARRIDVSLTFLGENQEEEGA